MTETLQSLREDYSKEVLDETQVAADPFDQFAYWFAEAQKAQILEPNAMVVGTADSKGRVSTRTLLLKGLDDQTSAVARLGKRGLTFYTNYESAKAADLAANPQASLTFLWKELERQVHVIGQVEKVTRQETTDYFAVRPYKSQLGAHASTQSQVIPGRHWLEGRFASLEARYPEGQVPCPNTWGGYRLIPEEFEFWQGRRSRLHDRVRYRRMADGTWCRERLSP